MKQLTHTDKHQPVYIHAQNGMCLRAWTLPNRGCSFRQLSETTLKEENNMIQHVGLLNLTNLLTIIKNEL